MGTKNDLFSVLLGKNWEKKQFHIRHQYLRICRYAKFHVKEKKTSFGLKLPYLGIFELEFEKTIVITESSTLEFMQNKLLTNILKRRVHFS